MSAREIIQTSEVQWIIERSTAQVDFDGNEIPGSAFFTGNLPARMAQDIKKMFRNARSANVADCGNATVYSISSGDTEKDFSVSATFGATKGTANQIKFNLSPFSW